RAGDRRADARARAARPVTAHGGVGALLRADARRLAALLRRPAAAFWVGVCLPAALLVAGTVAIGSVGALELSSTEGGVTFGVLVSGVVAFLAYPVLFRGSDDAFVRRLGIAPGALF